MKATERRAVTVVLNAVRGAVNGIAADASSDSRRPNLHAVVARRHAVTGARRARSSGSERWEIML